jgi:hypothetical protein
MDSINSYKPAERLSASQEELCSYEFTGTVCNHSVKLSWVLNSFIDVKPERAEWYEYVTGRRS